MTAIHKPLAQDTLEMRAAQVARTLERRDADAPSLHSRVMEALARRELLALTWYSIAVALRQWEQVDLMEVAAELREMLGDPHQDLEPEAVRGIAYCALTCFDVPTATRGLERLASLQAPTSMDRLAGAACKAATADLPRAIAVTTEVLAREPSNFHAMRLRRSWQAALAARQPPWRIPVTDGGRLVLEPLRDGHAAALAWQYRDPAIAQKTLLPPIEKPDDAPGWIASRASEGAEAFALIDREHGFVGSCELTNRGEESFFCLWIGTDWQGRGLGRKLTAIACRHAFRCGAKIVMTAAYDSNEASLRVLRGNGFADIALRALEPDDTRTFLYLAEEFMAMSEVKERLLRFSENANTGLRFPPPG